MGRTHAIQSKMNSNTSDSNFKYNSKGHTHEIQSKMNTTTPDTNIRYNTSDMNFKYKSDHNGHRGLPPLTVTPEPLNLPDSSQANC